MRFVKVKSRYTRDMIILKVDFLCVLQPIRGVLVRGSLSRSHANFSIASTVSDEVYLRAAKLLLSAIDPRVLPCQFKTLVNIIRDKDPCKWVRLRCDAALSMLNKIGTTKIPKTVTESDRERYIVLSALVPREYNNVDKAVRGCLSSVPRHAITILLCVAHSPIPSVLGPVILNYL